MQQSSLVLVHCRIACSRWCLCPATMYPIINRYRSSPFSFRLQRLKYFNCSICQTNSKLIWLLWMHRNDKRVHWRVAEKWNCLFISSWALQFYWHTNKNTQLEKTAAVPTIKDGRRNTAVSGETTFFQKKILLLLQEIKKNDTKVGRMTSILLYEI